MRRYSLDGTFLGDLPVPQPFLPTADHSSGVRPNLGVRERRRPAERRTSSSPAIENALYQDGPAATIANGSPSGILRYDLQTGQLDRQWVYWTDPVSEPVEHLLGQRARRAAAAQQRVPDLDGAVVLRRRHPGTGNTIKLYKVALPGATNVNGVDSLPGSSTRSGPRRRRCCSISTRSASRSTTSRA